VAGCWLQTVGKNEQERYKMYIVLNIDNTRRVSREYRRRTKLSENIMNALRFRDHP